MIRAIETKYNGYFFRSRLEARWAVFYDALGIDYDYEKEGFEMSLIGHGNYSSIEEEIKNKGRDTVSYLPDFWIPSINSWIEIKGDTPTEIAKYLCFALSIHTNKNVYLFSGKIPSTIEDNMWAGRYLWDVEGRWDGMHVWCECPACGFFGIEFEGRADRLNCPDPNCIGDGNRTDRGHNSFSPKIETAYMKAREARF